MNDYGFYNDVYVFIREFIFRLFEAHKRVQKVNQGLEDKLLRIVDKCETEKNSLHADITLLTKKLMEQQTNISKLHEENVIF